MANNNFSRRKFLAGAAAVGAAGVAGFNPLVSCSGGGSQKSGSLVTGEPFKKVSDLFIPPLLDKAPDGQPLKAGVIGCGGRGTGAALNWLAAGPNLTVTALGDVFQDRVDSCRERIKADFNIEVPEENCFVGFDNFQKVIDSGVDVVLLCTPPVFRPIHFEAAVKNRKHVFMEKPVAVDPAGVRSVLASAKMAESQGLKVVCGTQRRHQRDYIEVYKQVATGAIGDIISANAYWNQNKLWHRNPQAEWSEMECMIRDWVNWCWLSGDHIVEQHVHNIDVINWFTGKKPVSAVSFGARHRRVTGDQYDFFSTDFIYEGGIHVHSMCRQINGCEGNVSEWIQGTKGTSNCQNTIWDPAGAELWKYDGYKLDDEGKMTDQLIRSPYDQEHIDLVTAIRTGNPLNEAESIAVSTMAGIMGRISAYTGKKVTWDEVMNSDLRLGPKVFDMGPVDVPKIVPVPGE